MKKLNILLLLIFLGCAKYDNTFTGVITSASSYGTGYYKYTLHNSSKAYENRDTDIEFTDTVKYFVGDTLMLKKL